MATYIRLTDYKDSDSKEQGFFKSENRYEAKQDDFEKIPGSPIAYWVSDNASNGFSKGRMIKELSKVRVGMHTGSNDKFLRYWHELEFDTIGFGCSSEELTKSLESKWYPYNKGGGFRKWFGNNEYVVNWYRGGESIHKFHNIPLTHNGAPVRAKALQFKESVTWSFVSSSGFAVRYSPIGFMFDVGGSSLFPEKLSVHSFVAFLCSKVALNLLKILNPTMNFQVGNVSDLPIIFPKQESIKQQIDLLTQECIDISKEEWDSRETSWDFTKNELLKHKSDSKIETAYNNYCSYWREKFYKLHANEEELNRLFIDIYELNDELTPDVDLKDITILKSESIINDRGELEFKADEIMKQFISYAVGVMFGRYSLDKDGLQIANLGSEILISQMTDETKVSFPIDDDNVIPVLEDDYFSDDIASRVINFVKTTFGSESLSENINFIEKCLGKTIRAYMVKDFYEDHIKRYKKRPIYWMVSSPKKGFMSLSYMHRYTNDLFARVQNNYLREYITKLEGTKDILRQIIVDESASSKDKKDADKKIKAIEVKLKELIAFDRDTMTHFAQNRVDIDLDDGVKVNYCKFSDVLYDIKGLC
jgi:hypothetical protein